MDRIITERLIMTLANLDDLKELEIIEEECDKYFLFDPPCEENHSCSLKECITIGDIPPGGKRENYFIYCIRQDNILIGFLAYYLEYQNKSDLAYLSVIYVKEDHQRKGIGKEILDKIIERFTTIKIKEIRTHVSLRNLPSLRFFVNQGFDKIINVEGNGVLYPGNFGGLELSRKL